MHLASSRSFISLQWRICVLRVWYMVLLEWVGLQWVDPILLSLLCINGSMFAFCSYIGDLSLLCACVWKLDWSGNTESRVFTCSLCCISSHALSVMDGAALEETFSMHSALSTLVMDPKTVFLSNLMFLAAVFHIGIINSCVWLFYCYVTHLRKWDL